MWRHRAPASRRQALAKLLTPFDHHHSRSTMATMMAATARRTRSTVAVLTSSRGKFISGTDTLLGRGQGRMQLTLTRQAWNWTKINPDSKKPFFAQRTTKRIPTADVHLLRNAEIPMVQEYPAVFLPVTSDQVQQSLNIVLFMEDFNKESSPLAFNILACSSTGLIHYVQIANPHLSLIIPTYALTNGGKDLNNFPLLLKTFLEDPSSYQKVGFGAFEDAARIKDQYGIECRGLLDIHWMAKIQGVGSTSVKDLVDCYGQSSPMAAGTFVVEPSGFIPGRRIGLEILPSPYENSDYVDDQIKNRQGEIEFVDPRRLDWEGLSSLKLGSVPLCASRDWSRELIRCIAQDAFTTLELLKPIQEKTFGPGVMPPLLRTLKQEKERAFAFLRSSIPPGTLFPIRSIHHLLRGPFASSDLPMPDRDAQSLYLIQKLVQDEALILNDRSLQHDDTMFSNPSVLNRQLLIPGPKTSEILMENPLTRQLLCEVFESQPDEPRLMYDSDRSRIPERIQDLECFLGVYEWLEFLPGAEEPLPPSAWLETDQKVDQIDNPHNEDGKDESSSSEISDKEGSDKTMTVGTAGWSRYMKKGMKMKAAGSALFAIEAMGIRAQKDIIPRMGHVMPTPPILIPSTSTSAGAESLASISPSTPSSRTQPRSTEIATSPPPTLCGRRMASLVGFYLNFGLLADRAKEEPADCRQWAVYRIERLIEQRILIRSIMADDSCVQTPDDRSFLIKGVIRINPSLLTQLKTLAKGKD